MRSKGFDGMNCSVADVLAAVGDRWGFLVLRDLLLGLSRYDDFRRSTGVTNATLSDRLKHLESHGLVERQRYQTKPDRFEYILTRKGRKIGSLIPVIAQTGDGLDEAGTPNPPMRFINRNTGAEVAWAYVDRTTGEHVMPSDVIAEVGPGADDLMRWRLLSNERRPSPQTSPSAALPDVDGTVPDIISTVTQSVTVSK